MLNKTIKCLLIASTFHVASSIAGVMDSEDFDTSGANDTLATAQDLGPVSDANPLTVNGWVDSNNANDVDFFQFSVNASLQTLFFDIDYADDWDPLTQSHPADNGLGLDTALWVFNTTGQLIAWNDDSDFFKVGDDNEATDPGSDKFGDKDAFIGGLSLASGSYFVAVSYFGNVANSWDSQYVSDPFSYSGFIFLDTPEDPGFLNIPDTCFDINDPSYQCTGQYQLQIRTSFDQPAIVPAPGAAWLFGSALAGFVGWNRRRKKATA